jgi:Cu+-exporting ATPase
MENMETVHLSSSAQAEPEPQLVCHHCGEDCPDDQIRIEDKLFCCQGCKMVYEILSENDLCRYYEIDENAGISLKGRKQEQYAYLDDPEVADTLADFADGTQTKVRFYLPQIHCASCIWLLENLYKLNDGVTHSAVNFPKKEIRLTFDPQLTTMRSIVELLASIGYPPSINLGDLEPAKRKPVSKKVYYQLGVAGFAFGNIMLLSFPEYLGLHLDPDGTFVRLFGYLNILLALPVLFYSGWDYLKSAFLGLKHRHLNMDVPISLGILALFFRSAFEIISQTGAGYFDSMAGLVFFLLIGKWFQQTTFHHLSFERDYKSYFPIAAMLKEGEQERPVAVNKLEVGQNIVVRNGELIPADGILLKGNAQIDYSFVTGEAEPVQKQIGDKLFAGGRQTGERIEITLTKKVSQSYLTQLWNDEAFDKDSETATGKLADKVARYFTAVVLTIGALTLAYWLPRDVAIAVNAFTAVLIIACPCAVALSVPFTFGNSLRILAFNNFYLKNIHVIEGLRAANSIVFDKTGTLTGAQQSRLSFEGKALSPEEKAGLLGLTRQSAHPLSRQITQWLGDQISPLPVLKFTEQTGKGITGIIGGKQWRLGSANFILGSTVEGGTTASVLLEVDGQLRGTFIVSSHYRTGLKDVLQKLKARARLFLLSGDNDRERPVLEPLFGKSEALRFRQSPADKLEFIKELQAQGEEVMMLGDGLNDAGALKQSDTGIVIADDTNNFTPASDAILQADQFEQLPRFIEFARKNINLVYAAYGLALIYNIIGLSFAVQGTLSPVIAAILMPTSSVTIVVFGIISSNLLAYRMKLKIWNDKNHRAY